MKNWKRTIIAAAACAAFSFSLPLLPGDWIPWAQAQAGAWDSRAESELGPEQKKQLEAGAMEAAAAGKVRVCWSAEADENGNPIPGPNQGIPVDSVFYSSIDQVWQPVKETICYPNSVHQRGTETGTFYVSWNNGRGALFPYTAEQYWAIRGVVNPFLDHCIREGMTDFEKEMQIVQYLTATVTYPYDRYLAGTDTKEDHNAYGALVKGEAVCEGYAEAFCWLADACGLETKFIYGVYGGGMHDWNMVKLDGHWYHVDVTSDDPVVEGNGGNGYGWGKLQNRYLNRTDDEMLKDHQWTPFTDAACQMTVYGPAAVDVYLAGKV
ncbi:MAG: transglutaminase domain-containing protein [Lachnospiraceae bacterium]|nr:transglutaminase domain-containing protein [Lachnospiraceae bacterium]